MARKRRYRNGDVVHLAESVDPDDVRDDLARRLAALCPCSVREAVRMFGLGRAVLPEQQYETPPPQTKGRYKGVGRRRLRRPGCPQLGRAEVLRLIRAAVRTRHFHVIRIEDNAAIAEALANVRRDGP